MVQAQAVQGEQEELIVLQQVLSQDQAAAVALVLDLMVAEVLVEAEALQEMPDHQIQAAAEAAATVEVLQEVVVADM